ncbi:MAG: ABC transporter substrate-binding protein [Gaiellales bacterium]
MRELMRRVFKLSIPIAVIAVAAGCGGSGSSSSPSSGGSSTPAAGTPQKGGTLTILASSAFGVADPAQNYTLQQWAFLIDTHDGLVAFKRVGGTEGTQIVPDLAEQIPQPTDGGKTYTFQIRKGIKFSDGTTMKPSDFVTTFERQFTVPGPTSFYSGIVGTDKCTAKNCDLSQGVVADDSASTLTIHLTAADPEFLDKLALPFAFVVPGNTSPKLTGNNVPPGTGPYMWQSYDPNKEAVLVRNPNFKVWNPDAQPEGYPDKIVEKYGLQVSDEVTAVENDQADVVFAGDTIPSDRLNELGTQYASQTHVNALTADWYMALNTQTPPFNNLKARQAINYAFDRGAAVKLAGGSSLAVPTCQVLPPNFPGYVQYCPYTANATSDGSGAWTAPDYTKAKQLVQDSGTAGTKVVVNTDGPDKPFGEQMVSDLNKIGYKASLVVLAGSIQYPFVQNSKNSDKWQVAWSAWYQDYPAPSDFLNVLLGCGSIHPNSDASPNIAAFCDKGIQAKMDKALQTGVTDPEAANQLWAEVDHEVTDQAPWVDMYNPKQIDFLSSRVQGYQWSPQWYILYDQLWLKQ